RAPHPRLRSRRRTVQAALDERGSDWLALLLDRSGEHLAQLGAVLVLVHGDRVLSRGVDDLVLRARDVERAVALAGDGTTVDEVATHGHSFGYEAGQPLLPLRRGPVKGAGRRARAAPLP